MAVTEKDVIDYIKGMSVLEVSEMVKKLEEELGVQAAAAMPVAAMGAVPGAGGSEATEEKTEFDVILTTIGDKKINVIKEISISEFKNLAENSMKNLENVIKE